MKTLALVALLALVGCGEVTEVDQLAGDGGAPDGAAETYTVGADGGLDTVSTSETSPPPSCIAASCAACPGFAIPGQCAAIVACVRAGGQGEYPWQSCANMHAASLAAAGVACAQQTDKACP
jgi:hypothetical protein